jgi:uncharacterized membrane protein YedE/YeeE
MASGVLFGIGLALSGMTQPSKVIGFLDVAGDWDPSLALVMIGAIAVFAPLYRLIGRNARPAFASEFAVHPTRPITAPLLIGAAVFGLGWGVAGFCPGPGVVSAGSGAPAGLVFAVSMLAGMLVFRASQQTSRLRPHPVTGDDALTAE